MNKKIGKIQKKVFTTLLMGIAFSLSRSPRQQWKIITDDLPKELEKINIQSLEYGLHRLVSGQYIFYKNIGSGLYEACLTPAGQEYAKTLNLRNLVIAKPKRWDQKWRVVFFDIPEKLRRKRNLFRDNLKALGFMEVQRSAFCHPYPCGEEIAALVNNYKLRACVEYIVAEELSNKNYYLKKFNLYPVRSRTPRGLPRG